jgi:YidC/Oxa1 family membrane protein insertase
MDKKVLIAIGVVVVVGLAWSLLSSREKPKPQPVSKTAPAPAAATPAAPLALPRAPLMYIAKHELYEARFIDQGATLHSFKLNSYETPDRKGPMDLVLQPIADPASRPFAVEILGDAKAQALLHGVHDCELTLRAGTDLADTLTCKWSDPGRVELVKRVKFRPNEYLLDVEVEIRNQSPAYVAATVALQLTAFQGAVLGGGCGGCFEPPPDVATPVCFLDKSVERESGEDLAKKHSGRKPYDGAVQWAGVDLRYFLSAGIPRDKTDSDGTMAFTKTRCELVAKPGNAHGARLIPFELKINKGASAVARFSAYLGPKEHKVLEQVQVERAGARAAVSLEKSIDFWILGFLCKPMLWLMNLFYGLVGNFGLAIIFLTFVVKVITFWPSQRAYRSMEGLKKLKEPMEEIRKKYANDKNRMNQEMMALYRAHKINPLGGCLPLLIQMPIWIALYRTIYSSVEIYQQPFVGWIQDLSAKDPYYVLPILLGLVMFVQQRMTPTAGDTSQAKLMLYGMPILFTAMMLFFPSGLVLYIFVNTVLSIGQQWLIKRGMAKAR